MDTSGPNQEFGYLRELVARLRRDPRYGAVRRNFRAAKQLIPNLVRRATHRHRQLPGLVIVGAQKAGTTQLFAGLVRHPQCFGGRAKELQYFSKSRDRPISWYRAQFPLARSVAKVGGLCMEATPAYLPSPPALRMMGRVLPDAKVVVLLRDPVARAFSHFQHYRTRHLDNREFAEAVREQIAQTPYQAVRGAALGPDAPEMLQYVHRGYYALQLEVLLDQYPRDRVLVVDSADLFDDTNAVCQQVFDFVGLKRHDVPPKKIQNRGYYRERVDAETAALLREHYRPHDELLTELIGRRFRWMESCAAHRAAA